jgi:hypothetical protein
MAMRVDGALAYCAILPKHDAVCVAGAAGVVYVFDLVGWTDT